MGRRPTWAMSTSNLWFLSLLTNAAGALAFPSVSINATLAGTIPIVEWPSFGRWHGCT